MGGSIIIAPGFGVATGLPAPGPGICGLCSLSEAIVLRMGQNWRTGLHLEDYGRFHGNYGCFLGRMDMLGW